MERITTAPAATTLPSPIVTPGPINALAAIHNTVLDTDVFSEQLATPLIRRANLMTPRYEGHLETDNYVISKCYFAPCMKKGLRVDKCGSTYSDISAIPNYAHSANIASGAYFHPHES